MAGSSGDSSPVDLAEHPISFTTDVAISQQRTSLLKTFIKDNPRIFQARPPKHLVTKPPKLVVAFQERIDILLARQNTIPELNNYILSSSPRFHFAAEYYAQLSAPVRQWYEQEHAPQNIYDIATEKLSPSFGDYWCMAGNDFYARSGTAHDEISARSGTLKRQKDRSTDRKDKDALSERIRLAEKNGERVVWAQAAEFLAPKWQDGREILVKTTEIHDAGDLLHYRILAKLGEQLSAMCTAAHEHDVWNFPLWENVPWKGICSRPAWEEPIPGVLTDELRRAQKELANAKLRVENMTPEQHMAQNARKLVENLTPEEHENKKKRELVENLTPEQHESKNARQRVGNLAPEKHEKRKKSQRVEGMTEEQRQARNKRIRYDNLTPQQLEARRRTQRASYQRKLQKKADEKLEKLKKDGQTTLTFGVLETMDESEVNSRSST